MAYSKGWVREDPDALKGGVADLERWHEKQTYARKVGCSCLKARTEVESTDGSSVTDNGRKNIPSARY